MLFNTTADLRDYQAILKSNRERLQQMNIIKVIPAQESVDRLTQHIEQFVKSNEDQIKAKEVMHKRILEQVQKIIRKLLNVDAQIFGSFATHLSLPYSDIDLVIQCANTNFIVESMKRLDIEFKKQPYIEDTKSICFTAIPVLKLKCTPEFLSQKIDISFQEPKHNGLQCVKLIQQYIEIYSQLKPLNLVLKQFLNESNLLDPYQGGLSSYALNLMIISYLQSRTEATSLGQMLTEFLYLYGCELDYVGKTIYVFPPNQPVTCYPIYFNPHSAINGVPTLVISDPLDGKHNVGRPTYNIQAIKFVFAVGFAKVVDYNQDNLWDFLRSGKRLQHTLKQNIPNMYNYQQ